jgi:2-polyprenyl-3-methyl-5-hydroxy-6-metoxy-1,4-benzoquinol methylase
MTDAEPLIVDVVEGRLYPRTEHSGCPLCGAKRVPRPIRVAFNMIASVAECPDCRVAFQTPQPAAEASLAYMNWRWRGAGKRDHYVEDTSNQLGRARVQVALVGEQAPAKGRLLDFGAGAGAFVRAALDAGWDAHGVEQSESARKRGLETYGVQLRATPGDETYDVITLWDVVEHLRQPESLLRMLAGHLKPGGTIFLETGNWENWRRIAERDRWGLYFYDHQFYFTPASLAAMLSRCGYDRFRLLDRNRRRPRLSLLHPKRMRRDPGLPWRSWSEWRKARVLWPEHGDIDVMITVARRAGG